MDTTATSPDGSQPMMSPAVAAALASADEIGDWISKHHPGKVMETRNHRLAAPYFAVCLEHREAALLLISQNMRASAFALWRPTYENYMRGHWALNVAGDKDFQQIAKTKAVPKFDTVINAAPIGQQRQHMRRSARDPVDVVRRNHQRLLVRQ